MLRVFKICWCIPSSSFLCNFNLFYLYLFYLYIDFDSQLARLSAYGLRSAVDFDKYTALSMAESVAREAHHLSHETASFLDAALQGPCSHLQASPENFQAYFLAIFSDKDYTKVLDSLAKVDKAYNKAAPAPSQAPTQPVRFTSPPNWLRCFPCGILGHTAANCFRRQQRARYAPYFKPFGHGHNNWWPLLLE